MANLTWVLIASLAAVFQTYRSAIQKKMRGEYSSLTVTMTRYSHGLPLISGFFLLAWHQTGFVGFIHSVEFWSYAVLMAIMQGVSTVLAIELLERRALATTAALLKVETIFSLLIGHFFLNDRASFLGALGVVVGLIGGLLLMDLRRKPGESLDINETVISGSLGLVSALGFAICSLSVRGALLAQPDMRIWEKTTVLLWLTSVAQAIFIGIFLLKTHRHELVKIIRNPREPFYVGILGLCGSYMWFVAFALANAAYVKTVAQADVILSILVGKQFFNESHSWRELGSMLLVIIAAILVAFS